MRVAASTAGSSESGRRSQVWDRDPASTMLAAPPVAPTSRRAPKNAYAYRVTSPSPSRAAAASVTR